MRDFSWRRWIAVSLLAAIGAAAGVLYGVKKAPVYSSTATLSSARVNVLAQALPGYVSAATSLASTYARIASSDAVESAVARQTKLPLSAVRARLAATPVPGDPVISLIATGPSAAAARRLASSGAQQLAAYVAHLVVSPGAAQATLAQYTSANLQLLRLNTRISSLRAHTTSPGTSPALKAALAQQAQLSLRTRALASDYINQNLDTTSGASLQVLTASSPASTNHRSKVEESGLIGLGAGLLLGLLIERATSLRGRRRTAIAVREVEHV